MIRTKNKALRALVSIVVLIGLVGSPWFEEAGKQLLGPRESIVGDVTRVRDGDTIEVSGRAIRLKGLTCDERSTRLGTVATAEIKSLVTGQRLNCTITGEHSHDRAIGWCHLADGRDLGEILIAQGTCGRCARYDPFRKYAAAQAKAGAFPGSAPGYCHAFW